MGGRDRLREKLFLNSDIDSRHLYFPPEYRGAESIDEMQGRARRGAAARKLACSSAVGVCCEPLTEVPG